MPGRAPEYSAQRNIVISGHKYNALVLSSSPMPDNIRIIVDGKPATTLEDSNEPATKPDSISPNTLSQNSTKSFPSQSSSKKDGYFDLRLLAYLLIVLVVFPSGIMAVTVYEEGRERGAQDLRVLLPDAEIFAEREDLRKEEEKLNNTFPMASEPCGKFQRCGRCVLRDQKKKLAEKLEALDKEELEHLRQRAMVLEGKLKTQKVSLETEMARESAHEDDSTAHDEPGTKVGASPRTKTRSAAVTIEIPWGLALGLLFGYTLVLGYSLAVALCGQGKDRTTREREFKAQGEDGKKRREIEAQGDDCKMCVQELNTPKGNQSSPFAMTMLLGYMLALGMAAVAAGVY